MDKSEQVQQDIWHAVNGYKRTKSQFFLCRFFIEKIDLLFFESSRIKPYCLQASLTFKND